MTITEPHPSLLNSTLQTYSKKHGQLKEAVVRMVDQAMTYLPGLQAQQGAVAGGDKLRWLELLETLRDITEGKIYLELQRARLTRMLAGYHEERAASAPEMAPGASEGTATGTGASDKDKSDKAKPAPVTAQDHRDAAADLMTEIQVETYSSMDRREKTDLWVAAHGF